MLGNVISRLLGLVREQVIAALFGAKIATDVFVVASTVPTMVYDLLISGAISAALIPVFTDYADARDREELSRIVSTVLSLATAALALVVALLMVGAPLLVDILGSGFEDEQARELATYLVRLMLPSVLFMGIAGVLTAALYARQSFTLPAFSVAVYNLGIILGGLLLADRLHVAALVVGVLLGALLQVAIQLPGLRTLRLRPRLDLSHPGVRSILRLYAPVALGLLVSNVGVIIDRNLASHTGEGSIAAMRFATTLVQFPLGLVATATSFAVLPMLSRQAPGDAASRGRGDTGQASVVRDKAPEDGEKMFINASPSGRGRPSEAREGEGRDDAVDVACNRNSPHPDPLPKGEGDQVLPLLEGEGADGVCSPASTQHSALSTLDPSLSIQHSSLGNSSYASTLRMGMKMILVLIVPAAVGLAVLREPLVQLLFQRGAFDGGATALTALAFLGYSPGIAFAAVDQLLIFAFYARKDTRTPVLVGVMAICVYLAVALALIRSLGMLGLVLANAAQTISHAVVLLWLMHRRVQGVLDLDLGRFLVRVATAAVAMGIVCQAFLVLAQPLASTGPEVAVLVAVAAGLGVATYVGAVAALRVREAQEVWRLMMSRAMRIGEARIHR